MAGRPNPKINIGAVDSNCAVIVCDTHADDNPIVYCSEAFEVLTGYQREEIVGRNCRFLQSPLGADRKQDIIRIDNNHSPNTRQENVSRDWGGRNKLDEENEKESRNLFELKTRVGDKEEVQVMVTNYKKGGRRFRNLITAIPVRWNSDSDELRYIVGFQAGFPEL